MTARPSVTNRSSTSKTLEPPIQSSPTTLISPSATFAGANPISLGPKVIIQMRSRLSSSYGAININENCLISEHASIGLLSPATNTQAEDGPGVSLAPGVVVESGATIEATSIGAYSIIEAGAKLGKRSTVGENCKICAKVELGEGASVENGMVVYGSEWGQWRKDGVREDIESMRKAAVQEQGEVLRRCWTGK